MHEVNNNNLTIVGAIKLVWKQESYHGFWRGLAPSLARNIPGIGIHISLTQFIHSYLINNNESSMIKSGLAGFSSRCIAVSALMPFTVLKTRLESGYYHYSSLKSGLINMYKLEGWNVMGRGWTATLLRDAPFSGLYFMLYMKLKDCQLFEESTRKQSFYIFNCGLFSGIFASFITHPFDVIKSSQQLSKDRQSFIKSIVLIQENYGINGYFRGLSVRLIRRSLMTAISWTTYEMLYTYLKNN
ncbi:mitochondrial glycine transporter-like isoform X2 [Daktulosphaira vitifoliae]|uniref:mitochondrial glycine transporter-like isoform X2 n=1 Tax=Daktulosphaira vitifoliae TaxID=58002 RepID=UPI0021A9797D|nr:mitochondrial glycine transporter-like isoform X2 [Daktulosphaira vitifoliae]